MGSISQEIQNGSIFVKVDGYDKTSYINVSLIDINQRYLENKTIYTDSFSFDNLETGEKYYIWLRFKGISYFKSIDFKNGTQTVNFKVFDATQNVDDIAVTFHHLILQPKENMIKVTEIIVFKNAGNKAYNGNELGIRLPAQYKNLQTSIMSCCLTQIEEGFIFDPMQPIKPNESYQVDFSYELIAQNSDYEFERGLNYHTHFLTVLIEKDGVSSKEANNLIKKEDLTFENKQYSAFESSNLNKDENIALVLSGFTSEETKKWIWVGESLILLVIVIIGVFSLKFKSASEEDLTAKKEAAFVVLEELEKDYNEGKISDEDYEGLKSKYEAEAMRILKKIEKLTKDKEGD